MASITIRNLDDDVKTRLRIRAAGHRRSMEEEARLILREAVDRKAGPENLATAIRARFAPFGALSWRYRHARRCVNRPGSSEAAAMIVLDTNVISELMRPSPDRP